MRPTPPQRLPQTGATRVFIGKNWHFRQSAPMRPKTQKTTVKPWFSAMGNTGFEPVTSAV